MIKFHRPDFLIAPVDTAPAKRNLLQKIFHKKKTTYRLPNAAQYKYVPIEAAGPSSSAA